MILQRTALITIIMISAIKGLQKKYRTWHDEGLNINKNMLTDFQTKLQVTKILYIIDNF